MQDVTTRGEYYPDKNMATATVSLDYLVLVDLWLISYPEPTTLSPHY